MRFSLVRFLYDIGFCLALPFILLRLWWRGLKAPAYRQRWRERLGWVRNPPASGGFWIHAVSVGEFFAAKPLIEALQRAYPEKSITVTTTTPTGSEQVKRHFGDTVCHTYMPYDISFILKCFLSRVRPSLLLVTETEIWPNVLLTCQSQSIPVLIINARLSANSAKGYQKVRGLLRPVLQSVSCVLAQSERDAERFAAIGFAPEKIRVTGSIKYDVSIPESVIRQQRALSEQLGKRLVWIAASTHAGEEEYALAAHKKVLAQYSDALLILVPRHPERFDAVYEVCRSSGFSVKRKSLDASPSSDASIYLGDTMGDLLSLYAVADVAFVGGSLVPIGGHNVLEPAMLMKPVLVGPYTDNFLDITNELVQVGGTKRITDTSFADELLVLLDDVVARQNMGQKAADFAIQNKGALPRSLAAIEQFIK